MAPKRYRDFIADSARWEGFAFRGDDIVISTPAKCGTTWMQMLCALLTFRTPDLPAPLARLSPWLDMQTRPLDDVLADLAGQQHRRFIKTHTPLDGLPAVPGVTYLHVARDPRDVALSWDNHLGNMDLERTVAIRVAAVGADDLAELGITGPPPPLPEDPLERFWQWMEGDHGPTMGGFDSFTAHVRAAWERRDDPAVHLFHYADLRADLAGEMARLARILGTEPPTDELVDAATFERMKERAPTLVPNSDTPFWRQDSQFFDRARLGGWSELLDEGDLRRYELLATAALPEEAFAWVHGGWRSAGPVDAPAGLS